MLVATHQPNNSLATQHIVQVVEQHRVVTIGTSSQCLYIEIMMAMIMVVYQLLAAGTFPPDGSNADAKKQRKYIKHQNHARRLTNNITD